MLRLPPFTYLAPKTLREAVHLLANQRPEDILLVAGGTDVYPSMKRQQFTPKTLVGLRHLQELQECTGDMQHGLTLGAGLSTVAEYGHPGGDSLRGYPLQLLQSDLLVAPGNWLLSEEGWRYLLGSTREFALLGSVVV
jgi:hypothetical protein